MQSHNLYSLLIWGGSTHLLKKEVFCAQKKSYFGYVAWKRYQKGLIL